MTPDVPDVVPWPEPEASRNSPAPAMTPSAFERGEGLGALRRGPLEPRVFSGLPWLAVCVLALLAWPIAGQGMATAFLVVGFVGVAVLFALRFAERSVSVLHLWDRRQAARRELGPPTPRLARRRRR